MWPAGGTGTTCDPALFNIIRVVQSADRSIVTPTRSWTCYKPVGFDTCVTTQQCRLHVLNSYNLVATDYVLRVTYITYVACFVLLHSFTTGSESLKPQSKILPIFMSSNNVNDLQNIIVVFPPFCFPDKVHSSWHGLHKFCAKPVD